MTPKEEILEELGDMELSLEDDRVLNAPPAAIKRIREILSRHELVPIDDTPFDPERLGFKLKGKDSWEVGKHVLTRHESYLGIEEIFGALECYCPWPATHSAGIALLKGLGLEVRT